MKLYKKIIILLIVAFASFGFSCDASDGDSLYQVSIIGYGGNFSGMYQIDPETSGSSWVLFDGVQVGTSDYYQYDIDIDFNTSLTIFADGEDEAPDECASLKLYFYINGSQEDYVYNSATFGDTGVISVAATVNYSYSVSSSASE